MSNRTDYVQLARELADMYGLSPEATARIEAELHNAHVAGEEGSRCGCSQCDRPRLRVAVEEPLEEDPAGEERRTLR